MQQIQCWNSFYRFHEPICGGRGLNLLFVKKIYKVYKILGYRWFGISRHFIDYAPHLLNYIHVNRHQFPGVFYCPLLVSLQCSKFIFFTFIHCIIIIALTHHYLALCQRNNLHQTTSFIIVKWFFTIFLSHVFDCVPCFSLTFCKMKGGPWKGEEEGRYF